MSTINSEDAPGTGNARFRQHYAEVRLEKVLAYFAEGFEPKDGEVLNNYETFVDHQKGVVVFRLTIEKK